MADLGGVTSQITTVQLDAFFLSDSLTGRQGGNAAFPEVCACQWGMFSITVYFLIL